MDVEWYCVLYEVDVEFYFVKVDVCVVCVDVEVVCCGNVGFCVSGDVLYCIDCWLVNFLDVVY